MKWTASTEEIIRDIPVLQQYYCWQEELDDLVQHHLLGKLRVEEQIQHRCDLPLDHPQVVKTGSREFVVIHDFRTVLFVVFVERRKTTN